ncbi:MAG: prevent-host-death protein [Treponema sp.]|nr:prevent-host-death protein [Treponema sp.]
MLVFNISDFNQNTTQILNAALNDEVIINNEGMQYKILPLNNDTKGKSPLEDIPRIKLNVTTQEIVEILQECRAG